MIRPIKNIFFLFFFLFWPYSCLAQEKIVNYDAPFEPISRLPCLYKGRFRPIEAYSRLWLEEFYGQQKLDPETLVFLKGSNPSALNFLMKIHFTGYLPLIDIPLFVITHPTLKIKLGLSSNEKRFSYSHVYRVLYEDKKTNFNVLSDVLTYFFIKNYQGKLNPSKIELNELYPGLWLELKEKKLLILENPQTPPWNFLQPGLLIYDDPLAHEIDILKNGNKLADSFTTLLKNLSTFSALEGPDIKSEKKFENLLFMLRKQNIPPEQFNSSLESQLPFNKRLLDSGSTLKVLPSRFKASEFFSLKALKLKVIDPQNNQLIPVPNFTSFSDDNFKKIQLAYLDLEKTFLSSSSHTEILNLKINQFAEAYKEGYLNLQKTPYQIAHTHSLYFPTPLQLTMEAIYYQYPLFEICLFMYSISFSLFILNYFYAKNYVKIVSLAIFILAFALHTLLVALRCFILQRPPVANMFETVIYVPWMAVLISFPLAYLFKNRTILTAANIVCLILLTVLKLTKINNSLDTVQAVLNSNYWLTIHVLMVVGSYGLFCLSGILAHFYLFSNSLWPEKLSFRLSVGKFIRQSIFIGLLLLIAGTILGGVWAAESWGRFWDWDPKESWAFISICVYLIWVHAYMFNYIGDFGLAVGSIMGLQAISFTWYGVNYILGTGLHSYGFGTGGEYYYYLYLLTENLFLAWIGLDKYRLNLEKVLKDKIYKN